MTRLSLQRLSMDAVKMLAAAMKGDATDLYRVTEGNPFFVTEVLANPGSKVPVTVRTRCSAAPQCSTLSAREVLEFASIVPRAVEAKFVEAVLAPSLQAVEECIESGLLVAEGGALLFRH